MVGTFNIEKDKLLDKPSHNWPNSPTYQGGGSPILPTPEWTFSEETDGMTEEELKDFEKKKSIEFDSIYLLIMYSVCRIGVDYDGVCSFCVC